MSDYAVLCDFIAYVNGLAGFRALRIDDCSCDIYSGDFYLASVLTADPFTGEVLKRPVLEVDNNGIRVGIEGIICRAEELGFGILMPDDFLGKGFKIL